MKYRVVLSPRVEQVIRKLSSNLKKKIRAALDAIREDPRTGKALKDELKNLRSFRVQRYRIIYRIHRSRIEVQVIDIAPRSIIYDQIRLIIEK